MVVPKHTATLGAKTPLGSAHLCRFVILVKFESSNINPGKIVSFLLV